MHGFRTIYIYIYITVLFVNCEVLLITRQRSTVINDCKPKAVNCLPFLNEAPFWLGDLLIELVLSDFIVILDTVVICDIA